MLGKRQPCQVLLLRYASTKQKEKVRPMPASIHASITKPCTSKSQKAKEKRSHHLTTTTFQVISTALRYASPPTPPNTNKQILPLPRRRQSRNPNRTPQPLPINLYISPDVDFLHFVSLAPCTQRLALLALNVQRLDFVVHGGANGPHAALRAGLAIEFRARGCCPRFGGVAARVCADARGRGCKGVFERVAD